MAKLPMTADGSVKAEAEEKDKVADTPGIDIAAEEKKPANDQGEKPQAEVIAPTVEDVPSAPIGQQTDAAVADIKQAQNRTGALSGLYAKDIMQKNVLWCSSEESLGQIFAKMQDGGINYALAGADGIPQGIVSMSDLRAGMSPYLRTEFAKWHRPLDDASMQIKIKWLMSKNVRSVKPQESLAVVMESMCRFGVRSMPVVNQDGKVEGLITVFDILKILSRSAADVPATDQTAAMAQNAQLPV